MGDPVKPAKNMVIVSMRGKLTPYRAVTRACSLVLAAIQASVPFLRPTPQPMATAGLTRAAITKIRAEYLAGGISQRELAEKYNTSQAKVSRIMSKKVDE